MIFFSCFSSIPKMSNNNIGALAAGLQKQPCFMGLEESITPFMFISLAKKLYEHAIFLAGLGTKASALEIETILKSSLFRYSNYVSLPPTNLAPNTNGYGFVVRHLGLLTNYALDDVLECLMTWEEKNPGYCDDLSKVIMAEFLHLAVVAVMNSLQKRHPISDFVDDYLALANLLFKHYITGTALHLFTLFPKHLSMFWYFDLIQGFAGLPDDLIEPTDQTLAALQEQNPNDAFAPGPFLKTVTAKTAALVTAPRSPQEYPNLLELLKKTKQQCDNLECIVRKICGLGSIETFWGRLAILHPGIAKRIAEQEPAPMTSAQSYWPYAASTINPSQMMFQPAGGFIQTPAAFPSFQTGTQYPNLVANSPFGFSAQTPVGYGPSSYGQAPMGYANTASYSQGLGYGFPSTMAAQGGFGYPPQSNLGMSYAAPAGVANQASLGLSYPAASGLASQTWGGRWV